MDKKKSVINISVSIAFNVISMLMAIVVKRFLIDACGNDVNGLNELYKSLIGILSIAELGVGSAISFCMYKPIVDGDDNKVSALYHLFRKMHLLVGAVIFIAGVAMSPFIKYFAKDYESVDVNFYLTFGLILISTVITYLFGAKIGLINAYKNNYITSIITYGGMLVQYALQIICLIVTQSFVIYLACRIAGALLQWIVTNIITRKQHQKIISNYQKVDTETKRTLTKSIKAMFMHKVGKHFVNSIDSIVISAFVGVVALGEYSNYIVILTAMANVIKQIFTSIISVIGHLYAESDKETSRRNCELLHYLNFFVGLVFYLGYFAVIDSLVSIVFSEELVVLKSVTIVITINGFVQFMRESILAYRDATGTFYYDRWKSIVEGAVNIVLSILFVKLFGVAGVIVATIVTNIIICHIIEPFVLFRHAFECSPRKHYFRNYSMMTVFVLVLLVLNLFMISTGNHVLEMLINGSISLVLSIGVCSAVILTNKSLRTSLKPGSFVKKLLRR